MAGDAESLALLVDSVVDYAIFMLDPEGHVASWNAGAQRLKQYAPDEIIGQHFSRFYTPDDTAADRPARALEIAAAEGRVEDEGWRVRKDGTRFWANVVITALRSPDGTLQGYGKVTRDLTERKWAEEALAGSERRLNLLVGSVLDYAIFMLDPTGRVSTWNAGAQRLKQYAPDEIIGQHFSRFYTAEDLATDKPGRELEIAAAEGRVEDEGWRLRKDGTRFWANVVITALRGPDGTLHGYGKVTRDLTERKQAEDALAEGLRQERAATKRLRELDALKNDFVAIVAHDMRSPLSVLSGYAELILERWDRLDDATKQEYLGAILRNTQLSVALVDDVLEVARIEAGELAYEPEPYDVEALVRDTIREVAQPAVRDQIAVRVDPGVPPALGDRRRHWQALANILSNALRYSPEDEPPEVEIARDNGMLRVSVRDHGPGIRPEDSEEVFAKFSRLNTPHARRSKGTGLGLFITKAVVEAQGGRVWVESTPGDGATFSFTIPAAAEAA
jgi:PAS domain S-box-containing protein